MNNKKIQNLVVDSGAFIHRCPLQDYGENIYTIRDVINEIKDESTRESLQVLPYEIKYREPSEDDIKFVANFARKTGDFQQLSLTDIRLLALTVRLEKEINNGVNLKEAPNVVTIMPTKPNESKSKSTLRDLNFFGYDLKNRQKKELSTDDSKSDSGDADKDCQDKDNAESNCKQLLDTCDVNVDEKLSDNSESNDNEDIEEIEINAEDIIEGDEDDEEDDEEEEEEEEDEGLVIDEDEGWITKDNCEQVRQKLMGIKFDDEEENPLVSVGCITGDFAMQNVLLQMGLNVVSPKDGLRIRRTRQFVLRCYSCFKINPPNAHQFCKYCGNMKTLKRVSVTVNQDGTTKVHINFKKAINIRGTKYSLPTPKGGKHAINPILCEDQRVVRQQKSKMAREEKKQLTIDSILNDPDYLVRSNPFSVNDVYSRGSRMMTRQRKTINPNETRKPTGNRKKKSNRHA